MSGLGLTFLRRGGQAHPTAGSDYIKFKDEAVFNILMAKGVSSDGVGITKEDAAKVTTIGTWFYGNTTITSFEEFQYFTGVVSLGTINSWTGAAFRNCTNLSSIVLPPSLKNIYAQSFQSCPISSINLDNVEYIDVGAFNACSLLGGVLNCPKLKTLGNSAFRGTAIEKVANLGNLTTTIAGDGNSGTFGNCKSLKEMILPATLTNIARAFILNCTALKTLVCEATTPPTLDLTQNAVSQIVTIYVPDGSVDAYKAAPNWSTYAAKIKPLSEYQG